MLTPCHHILVVGPNSVMNIRQMMHLVRLTLPLLLTILIQHPLLTIILIRIRITHQHLVRLILLARRRQPDQVQRKHQQIIKMIQTNKIKTNKIKVKVMVKILNKIMVNQINSSKINIVKKGRKKKRHTREEFFILYSGNVGYSKLLLLPQVPVNPLQTPKPFHLDIWNTYPQY